MAPDRTPRRHRWSPPVHVPEVEQSGAPTVPRMEGSMMPDAPPETIALRALAPEQIAKLRRLAEAATPGHCWTDANGAGCRGWDMTDAIYEIHSVTVPRYWMAETSGVLAPAVRAEVLEELRHGK